MKQLYRALPWGIASETSDWAEFRNQTNKPLGCERASIELSRRVDISDCTVTSRPSVAGKRRPLRQSDIEYRVGGMRRIATAAPTIA